MLTQILKPQSNVRHILLSRNLLNKLGKRKHINVLCTINLQLFQTVIVSIKHYVNQYVIKFMFCVFCRIIPEVYIIYRLQIRITMRFKSLKIYSFDLLIVLQNYSELNFTESLVFICTLYCYFQQTYCLEVAVSRKTGPSEINQKNIKL